MLALGLAFRVLGLGFRVLGLGSGFGCECYEKMDLRRDATRRSSSSYNAAYTYPKATK